MNKLHLKALAKYLRELVQPENFDMGVWVETDDGEELALWENPREVIHECGTTACALGHATAIFPPLPTERSWYEYGDRVFGISSSSNEWHQIFGGHLPGGPADAAARIEALVTR